MKIYRMTAIILLLLAPLTEIAAQKPFRVMCYNVENLFDTRDNPMAEDEEFLPTGIRHWTPKRYWHKQRQLAKVIAAASEWKMPALIGLCEVENDSVLIDLTQRSPLANSRYAYVIAPSSDRRGLSVALLYQPEQFRYIGHKGIPVRFSDGRHKPTRDLLHVWGEIETGDTLDLFVCHFPSRYGGRQRSERDRMDAARTLKSAADTLLKIRRTPLLICMGDFNSTPKDESIQLLTRSGSYRNLFERIPRKSIPGSHKYRERWSLLDQLIIGGRLPDNDSPMRLQPGSARIFAPDFLLTTDKVWGDQRPLRTYHGFKYEGGFSDHLPLIVDFWLHLPTQN